MSTAWSEIIEFLTQDLSPAQSAFSMAVYVFFVVAGTVVGWVLNTEWRKRKHRRGEPPSGERWTHERGWHNRLGE